MPNSEFSDLLKLHKPARYRKLADKFHENIIGKLSLVVSLEQLGTRKLPPAHLPELRASGDTFIPLLSF